MTERVPFMLRHRGLRFTRDQRQGIVRSPASASVSLGVHQRRMLYKVPMRWKPIRGISQRSRSPPTSAPLIVDRAVVAFVQATLKDRRDSWCLPARHHGHAGGGSAPKTPTELGRVDARRALVRLAMTDDLTIAGLRGPRDTLLHASPSHFPIQRSSWLSRAVSHLHGSSFGDARCRHLECVAQTTSVIRSGCWVTLNLRTWKAPSRIDFGTTVSAEWKRESFRGG